jgi:enoyl-CoA hydratase
MAFEYSRILVEPRGELCWVTINRPGDRNSIDSILMNELGRMLKEVEKTSARAILFRGGGNTYFIGGADGVEMMQCSPDQARAFSVRIQKLFDRMEASPLVLVAAINGLCFGGGFEFAMACDLRVAGEEARVGLPEVKVGIIPGGGGTQRLCRLVGTGRAMEMILSGNLYKGTQAYEWGLVHAVAPPDQLFRKAEELLEPILRNPQHALSQAKRAVQSSSRKSLPAGLRIESEAFRQTFLSDYFVRLMKKQLKQGILQTTVKLPPAVLEEMKKRS